VSDAPHGDLGAAVQMLAADNARLCDIALAADKLAEAVERSLYLTLETKRALDAYKIVRQGQ
jgi:hypothetical protein